MSSLIIFCHPDPKKKSHSHKILARVKKTLKSQGKKYEVIDLYQKNFESCFLKEEYRWIKDRERKCELDVSKAQKAISKANTLIFIYPIWWYGMPAMLKGFMDRVFSNGFAYNFFPVNKPALFTAWCISWVPGVRYFMQPYSATGHLKDKKALIFRSYGGPKLGKRVFSNLPSQLENAILRFCGLTNIKIHELFNCDKSAYTQEYEDKYLEKVEILVKK